MYRRFGRLAAIVLVLAAGFLVAGLGVAFAGDPADTTTTTTETTATTSDAAAPALKAAANAGLSASDVTAATSMPICGDEDGSEPLVFNCPDFTRVADQRYYEVPGSGSVTVHFDYVGHFALCDNHLAVFTVDAPNGSIGGVLPGDPAWPSAAAGRAQVVFGPGSSPSTADVDLTFQGGDILGLRFTGCGVDYYSYEQANPDGFDHLLAFQNVAGQPWQFAWEDLYGGGDADFDDSVFNVSAGAGGGRGVTLPPGSFVALGDSYSSGEGNPPFFAGTDGPSDFCHRSPQAYAWVLGTEFDSLPLFYACSGATSWNVTQVPQDTEPFQLDHPSIDPSTRLVTMTIGGNNAGFSSVIKACIQQKVTADIYNEVNPISSFFGFGRDPSCAHSDAFVSSVSTAIDNVFWPVKLTDRDILVHVDPAKTSVIVAGYPHIFPAGGTDCLEMSLLFTRDDETWLNDEGDRLIGVIDEAAAEAGVSFVDVRGIFSGHEECGDQGSWLNGISVASGAGHSCKLEVLGHCLWSGAPIVGSFHPNASGHADGYAAAIDSLIRSATDRTPAGLPANPAPIPDPPAVFVPPTVGVGELTAEPVTAASADCEGTYQAGQLLHVTGAGFASGAAVQVYAVAAGLNPGGAILLTTLTADGGGSVDGLVRVPLSATWFGPAGATAGPGFLDAIGPGSAAVGQDDVAMVGLAPHGSPCGTVDPLSFIGFAPPVRNLPQANAVQPGSAVPVKFTVANSNGTLNDVFAAGYPQSTPVPCASPGAPSSGTPTVNASSGSPPPADQYNYVWKTDPGWRGCRMLIVELVDGSYHRALFDFGS